MNAAVIVEGDGSGVLIPVSLSASEIAPKGINNCPIESFPLAHSTGGDRQKRKLSQSRVLGKRLEGTSLRIAVHCQKLHAGLARNRTPSDHKTPSRRKMRSQSGAAPYG
jgi:hypothetical protein